MSTAIQSASATIPQNRLLTRITIETVEMSLCVKIGQVAWPKYSLHHDQLMNPCCHMPGTAHPLYAIQHHEQGGFSLTAVKVSTYAERCPA